MRRLILSVALVAWAVPASAQFTLVGQDYEECNTSAATCVFGTGVAANAGDLVVVLISNRDATTASGVSDATNGAYTCPAGLSFVQAASVTGQACYFINSGAATITPTITWTVSSRGHASFQVWRPTGTVTLDATQESGNASGTSHATSSLSTSANAQLVICGYGLGGGVTGTADAAYTALTYNNPSRLMAQYDITSVSSGSFTCPMTTGSATISAGVAVSFNDSGGGGGGGGSPKNRLMLGVGQ